MQFYIFGLLLCITISVHGMNKCTFNGQRCFIGGYQYFPNVGYYKLYTVKLNWGDAWKQCKDDGAHLVVINSQEEYEVIREMQKEARQALHVGIHDLFKEGHYMTLTGEDFVPTKYSSWDKGEPNNAKKDENCVLMKTDGLLNDDGCSVERYFVCEHSQNAQYPLIPK